MFDVARAHGVDYDAIHGSCLSRYESSHLALANFRAEDFGTLVVDGKDLATGAPAAGIFKTDSMVRVCAIKLDCLSTLRGDLRVQCVRRCILSRFDQALSSYGCPHVDAKYTRQYYKFAADTPVPLPTL